MEYSDIVKIMIAVVLFQNMGMRDAIESIIKYKFKVLSCTRCTTFWVTLLYLLSNRGNIIDTISLSFVNSYLAVWCELLFGYLTIIYDEIYDKISNFAKD